MDTTTEKVKILVIGDSGVGKSSLVHLFCHSEPDRNCSWTVGCSVDMKLHTYCQGTPQQKEYFVEFWDIGGTAAHENTRHIFYHGVNGIMLVHDLSNRKTLQNLYSWLNEVLNFDENNSRQRYDSYDVQQTDIPLFVVGCKPDLASVVRGLPLTVPRACGIAEKYGADEIRVDCLNKRSLAPGTSTAVKLSRFFDRIIEKKFYNDTYHNAHSYFDRRKQFVGSRQMQHSFER